MIVKSKILKNLRVIDSCYKNASNQEEYRLLSKLAIIELGGWVEESMDAIIRRMGKKFLKEPENQKYLDKHIIKLTHGFEYETHFRQMLVKLIGIINVEKVENTIDQTIHIKLREDLRRLKAMRDKLAHTYVKGTTLLIDSPTVTMNQFTSIYIGLYEIDKILRPRAYFVR